MDEDILNSHVKFLMDDIDDCKKRGAINDLSALAYRMVQEIVELSMDIIEQEEEADKDEEAE